jgi:hypothetical protein
VLNYFSMVTTVGTPQTVAAQELRIESLFPADETTEKEHASFLSAAVHGENYSGISLNRPFASLLLRSATPPALPAFRSSRQSFAELTFQSS